MAEYLHFGEAGGAAGVIAGGEALQPTNTATTIQVSGGAKGGDVSPPTGRSPRPKKRSAGSTCSTARTSTRRSVGQHRSPVPGTAGSKFAPSSTSVRHELIDPLDEIIRIEGGQVLATLIRLTGDIDRAEDALHDAVVAAADSWRRDGVPDKPGAWLTTVARNKALDRLRREARRAPKEEEAFRLLTRGFGDGRRRHRQPRRPAAAAVHLLPPGARHPSRRLHWRCARSVD